MNYLQKKKLAFMSIVNSVKGFIRTITGALPLTLEGCVDEESIIDYTIYGQSVQDGTPTPDTPVEVECVGEKTKNLFDIDSYGEYKDSQGYEYIDISNLKIGTKYTISANDKFVFKINKSPGEGGSANGGIQATNNESFTFTMTETYKSLGHLYIISRTAWRPSTKADLETQNIQLTESDTVLPYEPYGYKIPIKVSGNGKTVTTNIYLDEPLRKVGDYADYIDFENGKVVRNVEKYTFTGKETDQGGATNDPDSFGYVVKLSSLSLSNKKAGLCNCLRQGVVASSGTNRFAYHNIANHPFVYVFFKKTDFPELGTYSPSTAKQVVKEMYDSGVPMVLYYNRNTPTETPITLPSLPTFKGTSIISADTTIQPSNAEIEYYSNVKE